MMEKSIETIWKEGFLNDNALLAPKLNDLYNQKSTHIVDKLIRMFKVNLVSIVIFAVAFLAGTVVADLPIVGVGMFLLLGWLVVVGRKQLGLLEQIDKGDSSYEYLKAFDQWIKAKMVVYARIYSVFYPALFLIVVFGFRFSSLGDKTAAKLLAEFPGLDLILGFPVYALVGIGLCTMLLAYFAEALYRMDVNIVYGNQFKKLDEIIADMEELRQ